MTTIYVVTRQLQHEEPMIDKAFRSRDKADEYVWAQEADDRFSRALHGISQNPNKGEPKEWIYSVRFIELDETPETVTDSD